MQDSKLLNHSIAHLWILRILIKRQGYRQFINNNGYYDDDLSLALGLTDNDDVFRHPEVEETYSEFNPRSALLKLKHMHHAAENKKASPKLPRALKKNLANLQALIHLSDIECDILGFAIIVDTFGPLQDALRQLTPTTFDGCIFTLSKVLDIEESKVRQAFSHDSLLSHSGLLTIGRAGPDDIPSKLNMLSTDFSERMITTVDKPINLLRDTVYPSKRPQLTLRDYQHLATPLNTLSKYLSSISVDFPKGVNVLIYGQPGTGKSELTRVLAKKLAYRLYEVSSSDKNEEAITGWTRLKALRASQTFLSQQKALIVFDEVEDVFNDGVFGCSTAQARKGWLNRCLESNPVPTFWLTNSIDCIDPAFIRRFDICLEVPIPPLEARKKLIAKHCGKILNKSEIQQLATCSQVAPALITRATKVVNSISSTTTDSYPPQQLVSLIDSTLKAQGHSGLKSSQGASLPNHYDTRFINCSTDLKQLADALKNHPEARLCLYGPPGTGKSAYGQWIAKQLDKPLLNKKCSDIQSMWVGETEQNIAKAFKQATQDSAVLMIDEVDGFLRDRRQSQNSWEVTAVNELLTQMESFQGLFIATTNLIENLDQASLRRFDIKLKFDYLSSSQSWELFSRTCKQLGLSRPTPAEKHQLATMESLTPGDFALLARKRAFLAMRNPKDLLQQLVQECELKTDGIGRRIGFV